MAYLNVEEIEAAIETLAELHPNVAERIPLPHKTAEGRQCHALRIGSADGQTGHAAVIIGGMHAREWMPPDALVHLAADLLEAYSQGTGLRYGGQYFPKDDIRKLVEEIQMVLFPCVNPDGRRHTQNPSGNPMWRKNRRRIVEGGGPSCIGVDLNRNFDALWDFRRHFAPDSRVSASDDPCDFQVYVGPSAASEAETQNVVWLLDRFPQTRWFVDVHSYVPAIYHTWGFDENQTSNPSMSFQNPAFDGQRGRDSDIYREYIPGEDIEALQEIGGAARQAIGTASGEDYIVEQSFSLYPTSGTSDDYVYSRHFVDRTKPKVLGLTIECGRDFQPSWQVAEGVIRELSAGLIAFCLAARRQAERAAGPSV